MGKASPSSSASPLRRDQLKLGSAAENEAMTAAVNLANTEAQSDPSFSEEHSRKTFIGVKLDGRDLFAQPYTMALAQYQSVWANEIGLKLTAVQTKEHKIGGELAEKVDVVT